MVLLNLQNYIYQYFLKICIVSSEFMDIVDKPPRLLNNS